VPNLGGLGDGAGGQARLRRLLRRGPSAGEEALSDLDIDVDEAVDEARLRLGEQLRGALVDEVREPDQVAADVGRQGAGGIEQARLEDRPEAPIAPECCEEALRGT